MVPVMDPWETFKTTATDLGEEALLTLAQGRVVDLAHGYIPLLSNLTFEDKAAKGLRKRKAGDKREPAVYVSALEIARDNRFLLLTSPAGGGKTTFAKHLCLSLGTGHAQKGHPVFRNEQNEIRYESWDTVDVTPCYFIVDNPATLRNLVDAVLPELLKSWSSQKEGQLLIILDAIEEAGDGAGDLLLGILESIKQFESARLLVLGRPEIVQSWILPSYISRQQLLPLLRIQRQQLVSQVFGINISQTVIGTGAAAAIPAVFALALASGSTGEEAEDTLGSWLEGSVSLRDHAENLASQAHDQFYFRDSHEIHDDMKIHSIDDSQWRLASSGAIQDLLAARHLATQPLEMALQLFHHNSLAASPIIRSILNRWARTSNCRALIEEMILGSGVDAQRGALLVADYVDGDDDLALVKHHILDIINQGTLSITERVAAGRTLSRIGDPRDLTSLAKVPAGTCILGAASHPNSDPSHVLTIDSFHISLYPVVNCDYLLFTRETNRDWVSLDGQDNEMQNAPATDVTWHDARAYCEWLTCRWRASGRIGQGEKVGLPTEPQWERACRGDQGGAPGDDEIYPWGTEWVAEASNNEELALNQRCAVGLFPKGRSPYGCHDMTGQVWEWCTTLWGTDMASPSFQYPWQDDGRENLDADESIRRILRGGCFSSGRMKANCTYRGSLEPAGFWRGNGFRIVVNSVSLPKDGNAVLSLNGPCK